jgi:hypothetical protein
VISKLTNEIHEVKSFFEKLAVVQLVKKRTPFMQPEGSLPCSQDPATDPYPMPLESSPHSHNLFIPNPL